MENIMRKRSYTEPVNMSGPLRRRRSRLNNLSTEQAEKELVPGEPGQQSLVIGWPPSCVKVAAVLIGGVPLVLLGMIALLVTSPIDPVERSLPEPPEWTGSLKPNYLLASANKLFENQLMGPESIVIHKGIMYTGTADGKILRIKIKDGKMQTLVRTLGKLPCGGYDNEPSCGRPLGMRIDADGHLVVMDAYLGIFKVDIDTGTHTLLLPSSVKIGGKEPRFLNDLDISSDGTIYFSDTSTKWTRRDHLYSFLESATVGRLVKYDVPSNTTTILIDDITANGVQLSPRDDFVLVAEPTRARILKYHLKGEKRGQIKVFADNLPGGPDNIRARSRGGYWVAMSCRHPDSHSMLSLVSSRPYLRSFLAKMPMSILQRLVPACALVAQVTEEGRVARLLHDPTGKTIYSVSEVAEDKGTLYLGSYRAPFIGKVTAPKD